jgi:3-methylcrotonyl-CoA carboxylase alpha subunit
VIRRLLIANRGEIALRIVHASRELGIESVAVYSDADRHALHALEADQAIAIGAPPASESYLSIPRVLRAAAASGADAVHPGYGFLSENAAFADACAGAGLLFVGPPAAVMARMGSKIAARTLVSSAGVPVVPGETPGNQDDAGLERAVERVGLPALVKAAAGGGGKGMRRVNDPRETVEAIQAARREAVAAFGDGTLYVERLIDAPHHVEVQVFGDDHGHLVHLFERECSAQRRHQKVIEESPSPVLTPALRARMTDAAVAVATAAGYRNAGTVEFLVDVSGAAANSAGSAGDSGDAPYYFLEMNTRLQVEHPVTEQVTGLDLVRAQLLVASGEALPWTQSQIGQRGHAIEARVYAEDPSKGFLPQAGRLSVYREPRMPGVRVDAGVTEGSDVPVYYDPMIAKVVATAETRELARRRLATALQEFDIQGVRTNIPFLMRILEAPAFLDGSLDTAFLDREGAAFAAAVLNPQPSIRMPRPAPVVPVVPTVTMASTAPISKDPWDNLSPIVPPEASRPARPIGTRDRATAQTLSAPMPATVIKVLVHPGDTVKKGDIVVLLEAMKMELPVRALSDAVVTAVRCRAGELVQANATLVELR